MKKLKLLKQIQEENEGDRLNRSNSERVLLSAYRERLLSKMLESSMAMETAGK